MLQKNGFVDHGEWKNDTKLFSNLVHEGATEKEPRSTIYFKLFKYFNFDTLILFL